MQLGNVVGSRPDGSPEPDFEAQVRQAFANLEATLAAAGCTFDAHVLEISSSLVHSATLVMLNPDGNMDFIYLSETIQNKRVTYMLAVPSFLNDLYHFLSVNTVLSLPTIRSLCGGGKC